MWMKLCLDCVEDFLNMKVLQKHSKYLGLPLVVGQNKKEVFRGIEEKMQSKIHNWSSLLLSAAGRETLIKAVLHSIPLYTMSCCRLPKTLCNRLSRIAIDYWWSKNTLGRGVFIGFLNQVLWLVAKDGLLGGNSRMMSFSQLRKVIT